MQPDVEPRELPRPAADGAKKVKASRPDIIVHGIDGTKLIDVSIMHPLSPTYVSKYRDDHVDGEQRIIKIREARKLAQHAKLAKDSDAASVAPFVVDALGAIGAQAKELLQWLASAAVESLATTSEKTFMKMATTVMAVAIQRGNAALISSELPRSEERRVG